MTELEFILNLNISVSNIYYDRFDSRQVVHYQSLRPDGQAHRLKILWYNVACRRLFPGNFNLF